MLSLRLGLSLSGPSGTGGGEPGEGDALTAPELTRTTGATTYPPEIDFTRPVDWVDGITAVMQRSEDPTFGTGVSEATNTITAAVTVYDFDLDTVLADSWFFRMAAWSGNRPASLNWSNIVNVGDTVAPTITSSATPSAPERAVLAHALTADELVYWSITGGADQALVELNGSTLRLLSDAVLDLETKASYAVQVTATDYAGNATNQSIAITVTDVDENPTAYTFTDITGATVSSPYTSNTITIAGLPSGYAAPWSFSGTGTLYKNGVSAGSSGTAVNGDQFYITLTSSASGSTGVGGTLAMGGQAAQYSDTYTVTTSGFTPADLWLASEAGDWWDINDLSTMWQDAGATTPAAIGQQVKRFVGKKNGTVLVVQTTNGPILRQTGLGNYYLEFGGPAAGSPGLKLSGSNIQFANASDGSFSLGTGISVPTINTTKWVVVIDDGGSNRVGALRITNAATECLGVSTVGGSADASGTSAVANTPFTFIGHRTGVTQTSYHDGSSNGTTSGTGTAHKMTTPIFLGYGNGSAHACNLYGAVIAIGRTITSGEVASLHTYENARLS